MDVDRVDGPSVAGAGEPDVVRGHQAGFFDVDQSVAQDVAAQQDLAGAALEGPQVQAGRGELEALVVPGEDLVGGDEKVATSDVGDQAGHCGVVALAQAHDDVAEPAQAVTGTVDGRPAQQCGQQQDSGELARGGGLGFGHSGHRALSGRYAVAHVVKSPWRAGRP
ncbi:hypothetical protein [Cellulomonas denverensis]|uniref:hypothetical protein n=1 Tax=Cellulomonas denverensis TaxID=264297 RepID=UPI0035EECEEF